MRVLSSWHFRLLSLLVLSALVLGSMETTNKDSSHQNAAQENSAGLSSEARDHDHHHDHHHHHDNTNSSFCHGSYYAMFMDGFRFSLKDISHSNSTSLPPCLSYYVSSWKLDFSGKFRGAMVFSFLLALLTEGLAATRFALIDYIQRHHSGRRHRKMVLTVVYALQSWLGTMIMLVSMAYSIELLFSVIAGLMVGNFVFVREHPRKNQRVGVAATPSNATNLPVTRPEESQGLLVASATTNTPGDQGGSMDGLGSINGLQMQTTKEE